MVCEGGVTMIKALHWVLGIAAGLSLVLGVVFRLFDVVIFNMGRLAFLQFTATCSLASMALSLVDLSSKPNAPSGKE